MIGIFDSGLGGLTVLSAIRKRLPDYSFVYLADSAHAPYGDKDSRIIYKYTAKAVAFLFKKGCWLVILACNTASAIALRKIQQKYLPKNFPDRRVLGVVVPNLETIADYLYNNNLNKRAAVGLIGTKATISSRSYQKELGKICKQTKFFSKSCPRLAPLIESKIMEKNETARALDMYLEPLIKKRVQSLILACTHYSLLSREIKKILGPKIKIIDTEKAIAEKTADYLKRHWEIKAKLKTGGKIIFYTTGDRSDFKAKAEKILKIKMAVEQAKI